MSGPEIFVIIIVALLLFGAEKLPDIAKTIGKGCVILEKLLMT
jgi:sec-independent protein translocase protein TatA